MNIRMLIGALALTASTAAFAAEASPEPKKQCCCCKKDEHGKMACCKDEAKDDAKTGHEGHDMEGMHHH